jgi:ubiquinone/menaquinone biosynthesis C-methylase UbiE
LELKDEMPEGPEILTGILVSPQGCRYPVRDGIPVLIDLDRESIGGKEKEENDYYQATSDTYDLTVDWLFRVFSEDESAVRNKGHELLEVKPDSRVLETGCGTCRDSIHIARRLGPTGELFMQDLSANMLELGRRRMMDQRSSEEEYCKIEFFEANAACLPFPDEFFDAAYHFGGLNLFSDKKRALAEMTRVVRRGGKIVVGDEGLAPWLRNTPYGDSLANVSELFLHLPPLESLPDCARDVSVRWVVGNAFYVIEYRVGDGPPEVDLAAPLPG